MLDHRRGAAIRSLIAVAAVLVGIPAVLWWIGGNPFSADTWRSLGDGWGSGLAPEITPAAVVRLLAAMCWLAWVVLAAAVVAELYHAARGGTARRLRVLTPFQLAAATIVAPLALAMSALPAVARAVAPLPAAAPVGTPRPAAQATEMRASEDTPPAGYYRARAGDTLDQIAEEQLGDRSRWRELWDLNRDRVMTDGRVFDKHTGLREGWDLELPTGTSSETRPRRFVAAAAPAPTAAVAGPAAVPQPVTPALAAAAPSAVPVLTPTATVWMVERGQSLWRIAQLAYGIDDADTLKVVVAATFEANREQLGDPDELAIGMTLRLPPLLAPAAPPAEPPVPAADALVPSTPTWTVERGQYLYRIAAIAYGISDPTTLERVVRAIFDANRDLLDDPDLIHPDMTLQLPVVPAVPSGETTDPMPAATEGTSPPSAEAPVPESAPPPSVESSPAEPGGSPVEPAGTAPEAGQADVDQAPRLPPPAGSPTLAPPAEVPASPAAGPRPVSEPAAVSPARAVGSDPQDGSLFDRSQRTAWWSIPIGMLLASGIVVMVRRLRGRRQATLEPGEQLADPSPVVAGTELAAASTSPPVQLATLQKLLRSVTPHARELGDPPQVRAVELSDDRVEVLFVEPAPFPPAGWTTPDGGRSWVHRFEPEGEVEQPAVRQLVTPALVTLGRRNGGGEVLLDVETAGSTQLVGDRPGCLGLARSVVLELATYPLGVPMDVCLVGVDVDGVEHCDRVWANTTMTRAVRVARTMLERTTETGARSLLAARAALDEDQGALDPQVFVVDQHGLSEADALLLDELVELCQPQAGAAVVVIGGHRAARETVQVGGEGTATWAGAMLAAPILTRESVAQVAVMFDHAANAPVEPLSPSPVVTDLLAAVGTPPIEPLEGTDDEDEDDWPEAVYVEPPTEVVVRVMGEVRVVGREIEGAAEIELLALLVCLRDRHPNIDTLTTLLDRDNVKVMQNRISTLRSRLGVDRDGAELLPRSRGGRGATGRYLLSPLVMTDVELLEHRYQTSLGLASQDALIVLRGGLTLMAGPAFRSRKGYNWVAPEGVHARLSSIVNAYAARLMELAYHADEVELMLEAARCAGTVIDDPVAEIPMRRVQREYADATRHPDMLEAVLVAKRRLSVYAEDTDGLVDGEL